MYHMQEGASRGQKRALNSVELDWKAAEPPSEGAGNLTFPCHLPDQQVLLIIEPSLQSLKVIFLREKETSGLENAT